MTGFYFLLVTITASLIAVVTCEDKKDLLVLSVATEITDGFKRYERSLMVNGLEYKVIGMGDKWVGGDMNFAGGGQKINLLRQEMEKHKNKEDLIVMFTDSYDVIITGGKDEILSNFLSLEADVVFGAEDFCWPDKTLKPLYPKVVHGYKFLNSGGFIGYAAKIYQLISRDIKDNEDDQLYYTKIFLDETMRQNLNIKLDTQAKIFQNLHGIEDDVSLDFKDEDTRLLNTVYQTTPAVIHGNGLSKTVLKSLGNYLAKSWTVQDGCLSCAEKRLNINVMKDYEYPQVMMAIFITTPTAFLEEMLEKAENISYPIQRISLFVFNKIPEHEDLVSKWIEKQKESSKYKFVKFISSSDNMKDWHARNLAITKCLESSCDVYFNVDSEVQLDNPETLKLLVSYNRSVVAAIMTRVGKAWSTFWGAVTDNGFYARSTDYMDIINYNRRGIWNVPYISGVYVIWRSVIENARTRPNYIYKMLDADMAFGANMRDKDVFMYAVNLEYYGHLVDVDAVSTKNLHNDLWQVAANKLDWEKKYLHPDYYHNADLKTANAMPCIDVFWFPVFTPRFCKELIETMENYGQWSGGKNETNRLAGANDNEPTVDIHGAQDTRLAGGYENVPTVDIHMNQVGYEQEWLYILKTYIKPLAEKVYIGYTSDAKAIMNFVVRYKPTEQSFLRPHHDSSTYTINVALNQHGVDYEGGGSNFIRYNCSVVETKPGWTIMHPGRLTHYHEGLQTTKGTRYIMISFIDP